MSDLKDVLLKTSDELTPEDRDVLLANQDQLSEEDKEAYADILPQPETPQSEEPVTPPVTPDPEPAPFLKTEDDAKRWLDEQLKTREKSTDTEISQPPAEPKKYVPDDYQPPTWNEALEKASEIAVQKLQEKTEAEQKRIQENYERFNNEWASLAKEGKVPSIETDEGKKVNQQITDIMVKHRKSTFAEGYELWSIIPEDKGGGYKIPSENAPVKRDLSQQKKAASMIGKGGTESGGNAPKMNYKDLHNTDLDYLIEQAMK